MKCTTKEPTHCDACGCPIREGGKCHVLDGQEYCPPCGDGIIVGQTIFRKLHVFDPWESTVQPPTRP